jgi:hypothetical protein
MARAVCVYLNSSLALHKLQMFPGVSLHENLQSVLRLRADPADEAQMPVNPSLKRC